jgi:hypothetical protein
LPHRRANGISSAEDRTGLYLADAIRSGEAQDRRLCQQERLTGDEANFDLPAIEHFPSCETFHDEPTDVLHYEHLVGIALGERNDRVNILLRSGERAPLVLASIPPRKSIVWPSLYQSVRRHDPFQIAHPRVDATNDNTLGRMP